MQYFTLLTALGAAKIAAATAANTTVNLTHIAVGDGNGIVPMPDASKTALVKEVFRTNLNDLTVDSNNANWITTEAYISSNDGNFWIREVGIFDIDGDLIAIGNYPETFKPVMADGVAKDLYIKVIIEVSSSDAVTLQIDPSIVLATRDFVNTKLLNKADISYVDAKNTGFKNLLINGDFRIWQRGIDFDTPSNVIMYTADRWFSARSKVTKVVENGMPYLKLLANNSLNDSSYIMTRVELPLNLDSKTVTLSFDVKSPNLTSIPQIIIGSQPVEDYEIINTNWKRISYSVTLPANTNTKPHLQLGISAKANGMSTTNELHIKNIQLELGSKATNFEQRPIGLELSLCRRYFIKYDSSNPFFMTATGWDLITTFYGSIFLSEKLRTLPSLSHSRANSLTLYIDSVIQYSQSVGLSSNGNNILELAIQGSPNFQGKTAFIRFRELSDWIAFDAEIY